PSTTIWTPRMSVKGGMNATSTFSWYFSGRAKETFCTSAMASRWLRFIFQLPAMSGVRAMFSPVGRSGDRSVGALEGGDARELLAFEVLEGCPAAGGDVGEVLLPQPEGAEDRKSTRLNSSHVSI